MRNSFVPLLLRKSTRFHDKKTLDHKSKLTHRDNAQKMRCNANHRHCTTHCKPDTNENGRYLDGSNGTLVFVHVTETFNR